MSSCLLLLMLVLAIGQCQKVTQSKYIIFIDAGGSSSKLRIYNWTLADHPYIPQVKLQFRKTFPPGVSDFDKNFVDLRGYIELILTTAKSQLDRRLYKETPIYLMATAGMRLGQGKEALLEAIKVFLDDPTVNPFVYTSSSVEILSGEEEAVYGWIALNYLLGNFHKPELHNPGIDDNNDDTGSRPDTSFAGLMELGSRSTQIAFIPREPLLSEEFHVVVAGRQFRLYAHSYLQFGKDGLASRIFDKLCQDCINNFLKSPCTITGDKVDVTLESGAKKSLKGAYNPKQCDRLLESLIERKEGMECEPKPCAIGNVYQPKVGSTQFYATEVFMYASTFFNALNNDDTLNFDLLKKESRRFCSKPFGKIPKENRTYASGNCLSAHFMPILFSKSYGISIDNKQIKCSSSINGQPIDWSLGAALMKAMMSLNKDQKLSYVKRNLNQRKR